MSQYIEVQVSDKFDDATDTIFDALDRGGEVGHASTVSRQSLEDALLELDGHSLFDPTGTEGHESLVTTKARCRALVAVIRAEREKGITP